VARDRFTARHVRHGVELDLICQPDASPVSPLSSSISFLMAGHGYDHFIFSS